ncbi:MAG: tetratricopeptide repeat protein [Pyrinomonadaceae bacterium]
MRKPIVVLLLLLLLSVFAGCRSSATSEDPQPTVTDAEKKKYRDAAAAEYAARADLDRARKAIATLAKARDEGFRNFDDEWRFAEYSYYLGSRKSVGDEEAEKVLKEALAAASIARRMQPNRPEGHFWYAAVLGEMSKRSPVTVGIPSIKKIRGAMEKVIAIDENYKAGSAWDGLGQLEYGTRGMAGGKIEKAIEYYEKAYGVSKENSYIMLHLAEAYILVDRKPEARKLLDQLLAMKPDPDYIPEYQETADQARTILKKEFGVASSK